MSETRLGEPIAQGSVADIYAWGEGQVLKLFFDWVPAYGAEHEARYARLAFNAGLPAPAVGDLIEIHGRFGLVYERVEGQSMADDLFGTAGADSEAVEKKAQHFADLHAGIHAHKNVPEFARTVPLLERVIGEVEGFPGDLKQATLDILNGLPQGDRVCHGDYHPYNVIMSPQEPMIIDWNNASVGNPLEDVARTSLILSGVAVSDPSTRPLIDWFNNAYVERYFQIMPGDRDQLAAWRPVVAAARLADGIPEIVEWLLDQIRTGVEAWQ
jgi:tRNA A-37 threonylcarbamoyl transferase component Bud32